MPSPAAPLLVADDLRIDVDDVPSVDGLAFATRTDRAIVLGAPRPLFEAVCGLRRVVRGKLDVAGRPAAEAARANGIAGVALDPPLPPKWTPLEYVTWSARLAGMGATAAKARAKDVLARLDLGSTIATPLSRLPVGVRRATVFAAALATDAPVVVLEDPLDGLSEEVARICAQAFVAALEDRAWIVFASRLQITSPFALAAREALVVSPSRLERHVAPAELGAPSRKFVLRMQGEPEELARKLEARGAKLETIGAQATLDLGAELRSSEFLGMCDEARVTIVEMLPLPALPG